MSPEPTVLVFPTALFDGMSTEPPLVTWTEAQLDALVARESDDRVVLHPWDDLRREERRAVFLAAMRFLSRRGISLKERKTVTDQLVKLTPLVAGEAAPMV